MPYIPHTELDRERMLQTIGAKSIDELFREIPAELKVAPGSLNLPPALDEDALLRDLTELSRRNIDLTRCICFLGAGAYDRFIPSTVSAVLARGEFLTAYTPYQPEASQGYLQTIYEFQSMIAEIYGMDIANASMYDGATSLAEAAIMAVGITGKNRILVSEAIHPHYRQVLETYCWSVSVDLELLPTIGGTTDFDAAADVEGVAAILTGYPNFFGQIEDLNRARAAADSAAALLIVSADPIACALLTPPGAYGADVVVGEGQPMGVPMGLGGPYVGLFACKEQYVRKIPGRIVGKTKEAHGDKSGYVMTLRTREQDIRREKATSNICTNEALMALANTVYLTSLGKQGVRAVAETSVRNARYAASQLSDAGAHFKFTGKYFDEFVIELPKNASEVRDALLGKGILAGLPLGNYFKDMEGCLLVAVTEKRTRAEIDQFATALREVLNS